jgi:hypothetical protein
MQPLGSDNLGYMLEWGENTTLEEPTILALQLVTHMGQPESGRCITLLLAIA